MTLPRFRKVGTLAAKKIFHLGSAVGLHLQQQVLKRLLVMLQESCILRCFGKNMLRSSPSPKL